MMVDGIATIMSADSEVAVAIVEAVADRKGVDPIELPPLYDVVDTDGLEGIVDGDRAGSLQVRFTYAGYRVTIESAAEPEITLEPMITSSGDTACGSPS